MGQVLTLRFLREKLLDQGLNNRQGQYLIARRPVTRRDIEHELDNRCHLLAEMIWNPRVLPLDDFLVQALHVVRAERRIQRAHLVQHAAQRPNITLRIVRHVAPYFGACVVRRARLCVTEALLDNLGDVKITQLGLHISVQENIRTLHITVENLTVVQGFQSTNNLNEYVPDFLFLDVGLPLLITTYFLENISVVSVFHNQTT